MNAYIFVYSPTQFVVGDTPIKRFDLDDPRHDTATEIASRGSTIELARGFYGVMPDSPDLDFGVQPVTTATAAAYDLVPYKDKDKWPHIVSEPWYQRAHGAFPNLGAEQLLSLAGRNV